MTCLMRFSLNYFWASGLWNGSNSLRPSSCSALTSKAFNSTYQLSYILQNLLLVISGKPQAFILQDDALKKIIHWLPFPLLLCCCNHLTFCFMLATWLRADSPTWSTHHSMAPDQKPTKLVFDNFFRNTENGEDSPEGASFCQSLSLNIVVTSAG